MDYDRCCPRLIDVEETIDSFCLQVEPGVRVRSYCATWQGLVHSGKTKQMLDGAILLTVNLKPNIYTYITVNVIYKVYMGKNGTL